MYRKSICEINSLYYTKNMQSNVLLRKYKYNIVLEIS